MRPTAIFPTRYPYHFRATRCCVSLLTGTIYGSTLSIPEHFLQTSSRGGYDHKYPGRDSKLRRLAGPYVFPFYGEPSLRSGWKDQIEASGDFPRLGPPGIPTGEFMRRKFVQRRGLAPSQLSH